MATNIRLKSSSVSGKTPSLSDLSLRELAVNTVDGKLFLRKGTGIGTDTIVDLTNHSTFSNLANDDHTQYIHATTTRTGVTAEFNTTGKITTTNNVGIGTTTPAEKLTIETGNVLIKNGQLKLGQIRPSTTSGQIDIATTDGSISIISDNSGVGISGDYVNIRAWTGDVNLYSGNYNDILLSAGNVNAGGQIFFNTGNVSVAQVYSQNSGGPSFGIFKSADITPATSGDYQLGLSNKRWYQVYSERIDISNGATISVNSSADALTITQIGTGNALVVEDEANPDATPFVVTSSGSVGVGITNPAYKLDVLGDINFTGTFYQNGTQFVASRWTSGTGNDIYRLNGNVGIGTTNPGEKLDVRSGNLNVQGSTVSGLSVLLEPDSTGLNQGPRIKFRRTSDNTLFYEIGSFSSINNINTTSRDLQIYSDNVLNAFILKASTGNIGIRTTNPGSTLAVNGYITESTDNGVTYHNVVTQQDIGFNPNQIPLNQYLGQLAFMDSYSPSGLRRNGGGSDDVIVNSSGFVGIGTSLPLSKLHVSGGDLFVNSLDGDNVDIKLSVGTDSNSSIIRSTRSSDIQSSLSFYVSNDGLKEAIRLNYDGLTVRGFSDGTTVGIAGTIVFSDQSELPLSQITSYKTGVGDNADLVFGTYDEDSFWISEKLRITANGNVGIGTDNPLAKLNVWGPVAIGDTNISINSAGNNLLRIVNNDPSTYTGAIFNELYSGQSGPDVSSGIVLRRTRGTIDSPSQVLAGDRIGYLIGSSYGTSTYFNPVAIDFYAEELQTDTARGTNIRFSTTNIGQITRTEKVRITANGNVGIGTTNPTAILHVQGTILTAGSYETGNNLFGQGSASITGGVAATINQLSATTYRSVEYTIQAVQGTNYHITKILVIHDGTNVHSTEYGTIITNTSVATYSVDISGVNIVLTATPASASTTSFKIAIVALKV